MNERAKGKILEVIEIAILITLILTRFFIASEQNTWISVLNYMGLIIAKVSLYMEIHRQCSTYKKFDMVTGIFVIILAILAVIAGLVFAEIVVLDTKIKDVISLFTLLITLPIRLYVSIIDEVIKD